MTQEDKELLLKDLSARLPYGLILDYSFIEEGKRIHTKRRLTYRTIGTVAIEEWHTNEEIFKPYLRPMSSMTEEEEKEAKTNGCIIYHDPSHIGRMVIASPKGFDWLNKKMFDYRKLIEKGLAIAALEGMYNIKEK